MKTETLDHSRSRAEILGAIAAIPHAVQGKICEMHKTLAGGGGTATYYNLQYWSDGKNHSVHVPQEKLAEFMEAVEGGRRLRSLVTELGESDTRDILSSAIHLKKNPSNSPQGRVKGGRVDGARNRLLGEGRNRRTSQLEYELNAATQAMCREFMETLLTSDAATRNDYERKPGERHGGVHGKKIVTLFGEVGPVPRAYYYANDGGDGVQSRMRQRRTGAARKAGLRPRG